MKVSKDHGSGSRRVRGAIQMYTDAWTGGRGCLRDDVGDGEEAAVEGMEADNIASLNAVGSASG